MTLGAFSRWTRMGWCGGQIEKEQMETYTRMGCMFRRAMLPIATIFAQVQERNQ